MDLQLTPRHEAQVREFLSRHRVGLLTILFTDIVGSVELKRHLGDLNAVLNIQRHHALVREILRAFPEGEEVETAGDSFLLVFAKPSDAVKFALTLQARLRALGDESAVAIRDRIGIHLGEVLIADDNAAAQKSLFGTQVDTAARVMSLAGAGQVLVTRAVFDNARQVLKGRDLAGVGELLWMNHGPYLLKGVDGALDICEAGEVGLAPLQPPADSDKAVRQVSADGEPVLGWRPAVGQAIPKTQWELTEKLGEGGFGEVWRACHADTNATSCFKFPLRADAFQALKAAAAASARLSSACPPEVVRIRETCLAEQPLWVRMDNVDGINLSAWISRQGGATQIPLRLRAELMAQLAELVHRIHNDGVTHLDLKPGNVLVHELVDQRESLRIHLTDYGAWLPETRPATSDSKSAIIAVPQV